MARVNSGALTHAMSVALDLGISGALMCGSMTLSEFLSSARGQGVHLASAIGVHPVLITQWRSADIRLVPADRCPQIERATEGAVTCEEMRADLQWVRVPDADWPHPQGRPLLDVTKREPAKAA